MEIYKVFEKTRFGDAHVSYWLSNEKAESERQRLMDKELDYIKFQNNGSLPIKKEDLEEYYQIKPIMVNE